MHTKEEIEPSMLGTKPIQAAQALKVCGLLLSLVREIRLLQMSETSQSTLPHDRDDAVGNDLQLR